MSKPLPPTTKIKYLNNRDLLTEIHISKCSFSSFSKPEYRQHDIIINDLEKINEELINEAKKNRAKRIGITAFNEAKRLGDKKVRLLELTPNWRDIKDTDIVFRLMTFEHIPLNTGKRKKSKNNADLYEKVNFPPFQHWKFDDDKNLICVGKSHWKGPLDTGHFSKEHGRISENLGKMFIKLSERYAQRSNWRGYCIAETDEALTQRGWLGINEITTDDIILSYDQKELKWSKIKSIYRGKFDGLMHKISNHVTDMLVTPNHKLVTERGLIPIEYLTESDKVILMGNAVINNDKIYDDSLVELAGWILTEGNYEIHPVTKKIKRICVWQNPGKKADRIRNCLNQLGYRFTERLRKKNICFGISREHSQKFQTILPIKNLSMDFILKLTTKQKELLIDTMVDGDGHRINGARKYGQKNKNHVDLFQALCAIAGHRTTFRLCNDWSYGKFREFYRISILNPIKNKTSVSGLDFNGGKRKGKGLRNKDKIYHPNVPTTPYKGIVWCPETEYGCFVARRNGKVYLTGNTYVEEMKGQAILQLSYIGLQFDESKSENPFSYYTAAVTNSFTRILNIEKKNQNIRDDLLEDAGLSPSLTRQNSQIFTEEVSRQAEIYKKARTTTLKEKNTENQDDEE